MATAEDLHALFSTLAKLSADVNAASDAINEIIAAFQQKLATLKLASEGSVSLWRGSHFTDEKGRPARREIDLIVKKSGELFVGRCVYVRDDVREIYISPLPVPPGEYRLVSSEEKPLLKDSRRVRVQALRQFPALLHVLKRDAESELRVIKEGREMST